MFELPAPCPPRGGTLMASAGIRVAKGQRPGPVASIQVAMSRAVLCAGCGDLIQLPETFG